MPYLTAGRSQIALGCWMLLSAVGFSFLQRAIAIDISPCFLIGLGFGVSSAKSSSIRWSLGLTLFYLITLVIASVIVAFQFNEFRISGQPLQPISKVLLGPVVAVEIVWLVIHLRLLRRCLSPVAFAG